MQRQAMEATDSMSTTSLSEHVRTFEIPHPNHEHNFPNIHRPCSWCARCWRFETQSREHTIFAEPMGGVLTCFSTYPLRTTNITNITNNVDECYITCVRPFSGCRHTSRTQTASLLKPGTVERYYVLPDPPRTPVNIGANGFNRRRC